MDKISTLSYLSLALKKEHNMSGLFNFWLMKEQTMFRESYQSKKKGSKISKEHTRPRASTIKFWLLDLTWICWKRAKRRRMKHLLILLMSQDWNQAQKRLKDQGRSISWGKESLEIFWSKDKKWEELKKWNLVNLLHWSIPINSQLSNPLKLKNLLRWIEAFPSVFWKLLLWRNNNHNFKPSPRNLNPCSERRSFRYWKKTTNKEELSAQSN